MATGTASPVAPERGEGGRKTHYDLVIDQQLSRTRRRVKFVDLASVFMMMLGAVVLYLMAVVLVDHWIVELSTTVRFLTLGLLLLGLLFFGLRWVVPLLLRPINPSYAAQAIEQCNPSLKNSLLNFLMFRREPTPTGRLVYRALQQRAALDLKQVNVDLAVDKSRLIYIGYGVAALMVLFGAYTILSPKDVFQTVRRIAIPWADISRPTRVSIEDVRPGDDQRVRGTLVDVSAQVLGVDADDTVTLYYTTADKQTVDQAVPMEATGTGQRYHGTIPMSPHGQGQGIQQSLTYRIQAGDAISRDYQLTMQHTPSITVEKIVYKYPDYMKNPARTVERDGEIRGIEGTQVTVHAKANYPIQRAGIQFDPGEAAPPASRKMTVNGDRAEYTFTLVWIDANNTSEYTSYQLDFEPELGAADQYAKTRPVEHKIIVTPDLPPEIAILTPRRLETDVPLHGKQLIELRSRPRLRAHRSHRARDRRRARRVDQDLPAGAGLPGPIHPAVRTAAQPAGLSGRRSGYSVGGSERQLHPTQSVPDCRLCAEYRRRRSGRRQ